jgi:hypothetical protein
MTRRLLRITLIGLVALVALAAVLPALSAAVGLKISFDEPAATTGSTVSGECTQNGVTLVIDYGLEAEKKPEVLCAKGFNRTGWELFNAVNRKVEGTAQYPTGFVCRVNGYPTVAEQDCSNTPTRKQGTWTYFNIAAGHKSVWRFSMQGAGVRKLECGSVEGWVFSSSSTPLNHPRVAPHPFICAK